MDPTTQDLNPASLTYLLLTFWDGSTCVVLDLLAEDAARAVQGIPSFSEEPS